MKYISTRGNAPALGYEEVLLTGLAPDAGLYMPESIPQLTPAEIASFGDASYQEIAFKVMWPFVHEAIDEQDFVALIDKTYANFRHQAVAPLKQLANQTWLLELFHGPTLAFKDFALQLLGRLIDYMLARRNQHVTIIGATSGDTGSAAIDACKDCQQLAMFILHPKGFVSDVQRRQMTTVEGEHIHNIAIEGNFDDCQDMVKAMFHDPAFIEERTRLVAINSINWTRIMAQIVYYFYCTAQLGGAARSYGFSVPTGNFGDIFAGYIARKMGLPIHQLIVATNKNDILHRFISQNIYQKGQIQASISPSMDIQIASNFERLLYDLHDRNGAYVADLMQRFRKEPISLDPVYFDKARELFDSLSVNDEKTAEVIIRLYEETGEILDPHTAIGVHAAEQCRRDHAMPMITLATAHPSKFPAAMNMAGLPEQPLPDHVASIMDKEERIVTLPNDLQAVKDYVSRHVPAA